MFNLHLKAIKVYAWTIYSNMREERVLGFFGIFLQPFQEKTVLLFSELRTMYRGFGDLSVILISVKDNSL